MREITDLIQPRIGSLMLLTVFRTIAGLYCLASFIGSLICYGSWRYPFFLSHISYFLMVLYFIFTSYLCLKRSQNTLKQKRKNSRLKQAATNLLFAYYSAFCPLNLFISVGFWLMISLSPEHKVLEDCLIERWVTISIHGINFVFALIEFILVKVSIEFKHLGYSLCFGFAYICWMNVAHFVLVDKKGNPFWPYPIYDYDNFDYWIWSYLGSALTFVLFYLLFYGIDRLRTRSNSKDVITLNKV